MSSSLIDQPSAPQEPNDRPGRATGPRWANGKARSSQNALKHGACSTQLVLPGEDRQEFTALKQNWFDDYQPTQGTTVFLVLAVAQAQWFMLRQTRRYNQCEQYIADHQAAHPMEWDEQHLKRLQLFLRYRTAAERQFKSALAQLESFCGRRVREAQVDKRAAQRDTDLELKRQRLAAQTERNGPRRKTQELAAPDDHHEPLLTELSEQLAKPDHPLPCDAPLASDLQVKWRQTMPGLTWEHIEDIALSLYDAHPDLDPTHIRFTDLHKWITELPNFKDDPAASTEGKLEAIQMAWLEEYQDNQ